MGVYISGPGIVFGYPTSLVRDYTSGSVLLVMFLYVIFFGIIYCYEGNEYI